MNRYPKMENLLKRDEETFSVIEGKWKTKEFEYLANCEWIFTEKVDGTNIRIMVENGELSFGGKSSKSQLPIFLFTQLQETFTLEKMKQCFTNMDNAICLYGEGYGARIQKGGGNYIRKGVGFILFDIKIGNWWFKWDDVNGVARSLGIDVVPVLGVGTLWDAVAMAKAGITSSWGDFQAEGLVVRPKVDLQCRSGERVIGKIKTKDFNEERK